MKKRMPYMFAVILLIFTGISYYIGWHGALFVRTIGGSGYMPWVYWPLFWLFAWAYVIGRAGLIPGPPGRFLKVTGAFYFAVLEFGVLLLPAADLAGWLLSRFGGWGPERYVPLLGCLVLAIMAALILAGWRNAWSPVIRRYELEIDKPAGGRRELRIAAASDLHLGNIVGRRHLSRLLHRMEELRPDLILLPGDVIDDVIEPFVRNKMSELLGRLQAPLGVYAVLGNHEYYGGHREEYMEQMRSIGIRVLQDETIELDGSIQLAGRKDKTAEGFDPDGRRSIEELLSGLDPDKPILVMDHQPREYGRAAEAGADLLLSGHTHRGQFAPNHWVTRRIFELDWGHMRKGKMHAVVSSGFGTWGPPIRLASRSEVLEIVLRFKE